MLLHDRHQPDNQQHLPGAHGALVCPRAWQALTLSTAGPRSHCHHLHFFVVFFFFFFFPWLHLQHMEVSGLGVKSELKLQAFTTATAMPNL